MTYCVGIKVDQGLVFAGDTRTSASVDDVRTYSKLHTFEFDDRVIVLMSAGNLATTQAALSQICRDLEAPSGGRGMQTQRHLYDVAGYLGRVSARVDKETAGTGDYGASWLVGGQIGDDEPALYLVYPEGNFIACSPETPYMQIGETKYGKPILDRVISGGTSLEDAARCALVSLDSSMKSNISVGPPVDLAIVPRGALKVTRRMRFDIDTPYWQSLRSAWSRGLFSVFERLPRFAWEPGTPHATRASDRPSPQR